MSIFGNESLEELEESVQAMIVGLPDEAQRLKLCDFGGRKSTEFTHPAQGVNPTAQAHVTYLKLLWNVGVPVFRSVAFEQCEIAVEVINYRHVQYVAN